MELQFTSLNRSQNLEFLTAKTPEELQAQLVQIRSELQILAIYFDGNQHVAWIRTSRKIIKRG